MDFLLGMIIGLIAALIGESLVYFLFLRGRAIIHRQTPVFRLSLNVIVMILAYLISMLALLGCTLSILIVRGLAILIIWRKGGE